MKQIKRRSIIHINTHQAGDARLEFIPGPHPYIHFSSIGQTGFINDKDIAKLQRFAESILSARKAKP